MPERIGTRELRADLAAHVRRAGAGQRIVITSAGRAVATLGPVDTAVGSEPSLDALVAAGLVLPSRRGPAVELPAPVPIWSGVRLDRALREVRG